MEAPEIEPEPDPNQLQVELSEDVAEGVYANLAMIAHSPGEFVLDFIRVLPGVPKAKVKSRIIVTPEHAVRLLGALQDNIARYEGTFGEIRKDDFPHQMPFNFGGTMGQA